MLTLVKDLKLQGWGRWAGAFLTALTGLVAYQLPWGNPLENASYDLLFLPRPVVMPTEAAVVFLDEDSHRELDQKFNLPWDRSLHARLVDRLTAAGARAVVFDIVFSDPGPVPAADEQFAAAIKASGRVVLAADVVPTAYGIESVAAKSLTPPLELLSTNASAIGSAEMSPDSDLVPRRHLPGTPDDLASSLSWAAAELVKAPVTARPDDRFRSRWVNFYGPPATIPNLSYHRALSADAKELALFRDRVVFVGARMLTKFAGERKDEYRTPYSSWTPQQPFMSGVEIQATMFLNLVRGDWLERRPPATERVVLLVLGLLLGFGLSRISSGWAVTAAVASAIGVALVAYALFDRNRLWFPWTIVAAVQIPIALTWSLAFNSVRLYFENRLLGVTLSQHLSPGRVRQLLKARDLLHPGAEKLELTIMFTDIADFSTISEYMDSDELARLMNDYFEAAIACVHETDGFLVKLIGDALFVIWNSPIPQPDHRERAVRAGLLLQERLISFARRDDQVALRTRIGIHTGVANVGNFGSTTRFDYTAIGENINLASRMEGLNKHLGTGVLLTGETAGPLDGQMDLRFLGHFRLKGFHKSVAVHELLGPFDNAGTPHAWRQSFAEGLDHFKKKKLTEAREAFTRTLELRPGDGPSLFYIGLMTEMLPEFMPDDWVGEVEIKEK